MPKKDEGKRVKIKCYTTINEGEIRFGRAVEEKHFGKKGVQLGVVGKPVMYECEKCGKSVRWEEIEETICPCCGTFIRNHRKDQKSDCGGRVVEKEFRPIGIR